MLQSYKEYHKPTRILSNKDILAILISELKDIGVKRPLLMADGTDAGAAEALLLFAQYNMGIGEIIDNVTGDADLNKVQKIADIFRKKKCDAIMVVGGGAVMDMAKGVNVLVSEGGSDLFSYAGRSHLHNPMGSLVFVPLTSAMGRDMSAGAVIHETGKNIRINLSSPFLVPDVVVLSSEIFTQVPPEITAFGGMAALAGAVDGYLFVGENTLIESSAFKAISLVREAILMPGQGSYKQEEVQYDSDARQNLAHAAALAGTVNCEGGMITALARSAEFVCNIPLDVAMSLLLPFVLENQLNFCEEKIARLFLPMAGETVYARTPEPKRGRQMLYHVMQLMKALKDLFDIPLSLKQIRVPRNELRIIAQMALDDFGGPMTPGRESLKDIENILSRAFV